MSLVDQARALSNGAAPHKLPVPPRRQLIPYAGAETAQAPDVLPPGTVVDGIDCGGMIDDPKKAGIPVYVQAQNRKALTPEQRLAVDAKIAAAKLAASHNSALAPKAKATEPEPPKTTRAQEKAEKKTARKQAATEAKAALKAGRAAARAAKAGAPKPKRVPGELTIGGVANAAILAGKSNEEALAAVMKAFPKCKSNLSCISWYRGRLRESGELKGAAAARSAPAKAEAKPKAKAKAAASKVAKKTAKPKGRRPTKGR